MTSAKHSTWLDLTFENPLDQALFCTLCETTASNPEYVFKHAEELIRQGADPNAIGIDNDVRKPTYLAAGVLAEPNDGTRIPMVRVAQFLVEHGFDPKRDSGKSGAQTLAFSFLVNQPEPGLMDCLKYLLSVGADPSCPYAVIDFLEDDYFTTSCVKIRHGDPKNALNCVYMNMVESEHDSFDLWAPTAFWTIHQILAKAARKENFNAIAYCSTCLGQRLKELYVIGSDKVAPSLCAKKSIDFTFGPDCDSDEPCFVLVFESTALVVNQFLYSFCDDSLVNFDAGTQIELPPELQDVRIADLRGRRDQMGEHNDNLLCAFENAKGLCLTRFADKDVLQASFVPVVSLARSSKPFSNSVLSSDFFAVRHWW